MNDQATECRTGALWSQRARATPFACPDIGPGAIAMTSTTVVPQETNPWGTLQALADPSKQKGNMVPGGGVEPPRY